MLTSTQTGCYESEKPGPIESDDADEGVILCKDTLSQIWLDMKRTTLPSEVSPVPREVGSPSAGKLTADQWRTFCTVHLVVSLIRLWGKEQPDSRRYKILDNFLHLVTLTNLLHMRQMTPGRIRFIEEENLIYLGGLRALYPRSSLVPKHHMALHLPTMLRDFGPVHAWRTFAFERLNQTFQNFSTNNLLGRFCRMYEPTSPASHDDRAVGTYDTGSVLHDARPSQLNPSFARRFTAADRSVPSSPQTEKGGDTDD